METILHGAFELIVQHQKVFPGDVINQEPIINNQYTYTGEYPFYNIITKNTMRVRNLSTNDITSFGVGDVSNVKVMPDGKYELLNDEYYEFFCFSPYLNAAYLPLISKLDPFVLPAGEDITVPQGTRIFMMEGSVNIGEKNYSNINRLRFVSGSKKITSLRNTYGVYIK